MSHETSVTTSGGLRCDLPPMRLFEKAKRFSIWNPSGIDLGQAVRDWQRLTAEEQDIPLRLSALFLAGEKAVTLDILPLTMVIASPDEINRTTLAAIERADG